MEANDRRQVSRVAVAVQAHLELHVDEGAEPLCLQVELQDLNEVGCLAQATLSTQMYNTLRQRTCTGYVDFKNYPGLPSKLFAKTVWVQRQTTPEGEIYHIGLYFENCPKPHVAILRRFVAQFQPDIEEL